MVQDQKKPKTLGPTKGSGNSPLDLKDVRQQVPEIDDLLGEIDKVLQKTEAEIQGCRC